MRLFRILMVLLLLAGAQSAQSALPGDAAGRQKEMLTHRREKMALFETEKQKRAAAMISRDQQVRQEMAMPPGGRVAAGPSAVVVAEPVSSAAVARQRTSKKVAVVEKSEQQSEVAPVSGDRRVRQQTITQPQGRVVAAAPEAVAENPAPSEPSAAVAEQHTPKWLVSIIIILCIGGFVWWVRIKTELRP